MIPDHYDTLGVAPTSEDVVIRAAYLALMRRYHPDRNASAEALERARAITAAYAVLGDWDRRAEYDLKRVRLRALEATANIAPRRPPPSPSLLFAGASVLLLLLVIVRPPLFASEKPDRLAAAPVHQAAASAAKRYPLADCSAPATRDAIKRELFRRAARLRGGDRAEFDRLAGYSLIRVDSPELTHENKGSVGCTAMVALDLPPGVAVLGGRRTLTADVDYSVGGKAVRLSNEGLIVTPLATLAQIRRPVEQPIALPAVAEAEPQKSRPRLAQIPPTSTLPAAARSARVEPQRAAAAQPRPSFSCKIARGRGETAVCKSADLAKLDRHMGMLYGQSWGQANAAKRERLLGTRDGFLAKRDACRSDSCISAAYVARMREISDIMSAK